MMILDFFNLFGPVSYLMMGASVFIVAIILERSFHFIFLPRLSEKVIEHIEQDVISKDIDKAKSRIKSLRPKSQKIVEPLFIEQQEYAQQEVTLHLIRIRQKLQQPLLWLNLMALISPMMGLLGTIWSMSHSFSALASSFSGGSLESLIRYLSEAMWATAFGIVLALISLCALYILRQLSEAYLNNLENALNSLSLRLSRVSL